MKIHAITMQQVLCVTLVKLKLKLKATLELLKITASYEGPGHVRDRVNYPVISLVKNNFALMGSLS